ncbi:MAG: glycosyltransferase family 4 protein [Ignavibacteriae bacterium]|nr:glycosyltransferase family 4 protein [Ignavibacteriota bacterium]
MINRKIKVCFFFDDLKIGGSQKLMCDIIELIDKSIFHINIIVLDKNYESNSLYNNLSDYDVKFLNIRGSLNLMRNIMIVYNEISNKDFVISASPDSNLYCAVIKRIFRKISYFICFTHGVDGYYIEDEYYSKVKNNYGFLYTIKERYLLNYFLKYYDRFITVCDSLKIFLTDVRNVNPAIIQTLYLGLIIEKYINIYNEEDSNSLRKSLELSNDDFVIIYSGRLSYAKGLERLIETFYLFKKNKESVKLIILGDGELKDLLISETVKYNLINDCIFLDFNKDYIKYINISNLYLLPSMSESTNLGVQEAMLLKKIVLSSDTGGMAELILDKINGFLFKCGDYNDLLTKMDYIYENRDELDDLKTLSKEEILNRFNLTDNVKILEGILIRQLKGNND